jgi:parvulin-like peptidyl-prolyl isomerase
MKTAIAIVILGSLLSLPVVAGDVDPQSMLAEWDGGGVSVEQYVTWWERMNPRERPVLDSREARIEFLNNVINAQLMLEEAHRLELDKSPNVVDWVAIRRNNMLREYVFTRAAEGRVLVDEDEVEGFFARRVEQITASHIVVPTLEKARSIVDSLEAGVPFEDLATDYSTCASGSNKGYLGPVRWGDFSDRWNAVAFDLEPGEVSNPFEVSDGFCIVKVHSKNVAQLADPEAEKAAIRSRLLKDATFEEQASYLDSLNTGYNVEVDLNAVIDLCARYGEALEALGLTAEIVDIDIELPLTETDKKIPVVTFDGGVFDYEDVGNIINGQPYVVRPNLDDPDQMIPFLTRQINDSLVIREAYKLGYDKQPEIAGELEKLTQKRTLMRFYNYLNATTEIPADTVRLFYESRAEEFKTQPGHTGSKLVTRTRPEADSLLTLIKQGASFEELARENSIDPFTAPEGGDMGFMVKGKDPEFDGFFATMEEGDIDIFRSVEGHVILWLRKRQVERVPSFEEAYEAAEQSLAPVYKARTVKEWVKKRRDEANLKVNEELLLEVDPGS